MLRAIAGCESGDGPRSAGNPRAINDETLRHFGLFQFDGPTWRSVGEHGDPRNASVERQYAAASRLLAARGTQPWNASKHCWGTVVAPVKPGAIKAVSTPTPRGTFDRAPQGRTARGVDTTGSGVPDGYRVRRGDTLGALAARYATTVAEIAGANRIGNPDLIRVGQRLV